MRAAILLGAVIQKAQSEPEEKTNSIDIVESNPQQKHSMTSVTFIEEHCKIGTSLNDSL